MVGFGYKKVLLFFFTLERLSKCVQLLNIRELGEQKNKSVLYRRKD